MTMFSIKPQFNLPEFLAVPAPVGTARSLNARRRKMQFRTNVPAEHPTQPTPSAPPAPAETQE